MRAKILKALTGLRHNYWFWPSLLTLVAIVLGSVLPLVDGRVGTGWMEATGFGRPVQVDGARAILTTIAGAVLGVAGVSFSITIVAVSFASGNYGPRLIGNFMRDRINQVVLGIFVATFVYAISVLSTVHAASDGQSAQLAAFVPQIALMVALALTLISIGALIVFIHHVPESIDIMNLVAEVGMALRARVSAVLDEAGEMEKSPHGPWQDGADDGARALYAPLSGYVQQVDVTYLADEAKEAGVQVRAIAPPGTFVVKGEAVLLARPAHKVDTALGERLCAGVVVGAQRSDVQDIAFLADQLVEVLARALSPGVNDPFTAMTCLDWMRSALTAFVDEETPQRADDSAIVIHRMLTLQTMVQRTFQRARPYVATDRNTAIHAMGALGRLVHAAKREDDVAVLTREMERLADAVLAVFEDADTRRTITDLAKGQAADTASGRPRVPVGA
ncbi:MAG: DUF2254 domain-containing protein [Pseudomonadota bacterium]